MIKLFAGCFAKLRFLAVLSSLWVTMAHAHEVLPTIADLTVDEGTVTLEMQLTLEAFLAGIDLDGLEDTDDAEQSEIYDALRARPIAELEAELAPLLAAWNGLPLVSAGDAPVVLSVRTLGLTGPQSVGGARVSKLVLAGDVTDGAASLRVSWPDGAGALALRQQGVDEPFTGYLEEGGTTADIPLAGGGALSGWQNFVSYIPVGFDHILPKGLDHILFVLGLFLFSTRIAPLLWQVSAFTLAHTVTLALGALGVVTISPAIIEPLIAATIVYVAVENIFVRRMTPWRPVVVFCFGLLHGLGFASVLGSFGMPQGAFVPALIGFNIGVEIGQLVVIAIAATLLWFAVGLARRADNEAEEMVVGDYPVMFRAVSVIGSLIIGLVGLWWVLERTVLG